VTVGRHVASTRHVAVLLACAILLAPGCVLGTRTPFSSGALKPAEGPTWEVSGGIVGSARTETGTSDGWMVAVARRDPEDDWLFGGVAFQGELSRLTDADELTITRIVYGADVQMGWLRYGGGYAFCGGDDVWGAGLQLTAGVGAAAEYGEIRLAVGGYLWLGARDDEFDVDVEGDLRLTAGLRF
jgi:hypothetical protein